MWCLLCARSPFSSLSCVGSLLQSGDETDDVRPGGGAEIASHMAKYEPIKRSLTIIEGNVHEVNALKGKSKTTANDRARKEVMQQLEKVMDSTNKNGGLIKKQLDAIKAENQAYSEKEGVRVHA